MRGVRIATRAGSLTMGIVAVSIAALTLLAASTASAKGSASVAVKNEYRKVLLAEFFGPARGVCSQLTGAGVRAYTSGAYSCARTFAMDQRAIDLKLGGGRGSATARGRWRAEVRFVLAHVKVKVRGRHATAIDSSVGVHRTHLVVVGRHWKFRSSPPPPG